MELAAQDPHVADAFVFLDRDVPVLKPIKGFSARCERALKQVIKSQESFEDLADFLAEVQAARLFLKFGFLKEFESVLPVLVPLGEKPPNCDLLVIVNKVRAIPSPFVVFLSLNSSRLQSPIVDRIVEEITETLAKMETEESHVGEDQPESDEVSHW